jgi:hypothetical protein
MLMLKKYYHLLLLVLSPFTFISNGQAQVKSPNDFLPHQLGEQFTPHHLVVDYFQYLAKESPMTMSLVEYGTTSEDRPLLVAIFSSSENIAKLEQHRINNLRLAQLGPDQKEGVISGMPSIVWLNMSVHGNEPSGAEGSMQLAWELSQQKNDSIKIWLQNTIVIIDPAANPDGYDRYTNWYRGVSNKLKNPNHFTREHQEPWPGGRPNHYYFDLNRDWAWATQKETQQRLAFFQSWLPHVLADVHEQFIDDPYYFAPAAEPMHAYLSSWQRSFQTEIGINHAKHFDEKGWLYFTNEIFDLLYPSYGDTYPMFNGAIGMTYEQAGHGKAGRAIKTSNGDTLTLITRIEHHLTACRSTIEIASKNTPKIVENFLNYFKTTSKNPPGEYKSFIIKGSNDPNKLNTLCKFLDLHKIRYGKAGKTFDVPKAFNYFTGKEDPVTVESNDLVISAYQPKSVLTQVLFEPNVFLSDSLTYDITAWALPFAHGLQAFATKQRLEPQKSFVPYIAPSPTAIAPTYAWCLHRKSLSDCSFVAHLLNKGIKIRYATEAFDLSDQHFEPGAFVINRADNRINDPELEKLIKETALKTNTALYPAYTGFIGKGADFGSSKFKLVKNPSVAMLYGDDVDENTFGHFWHYFEQELNYPINMVRSDKISAAALSGINTLIIPNGSYRFEEKTLTLLRDWVGDGGKIIAIDGGVRALADNSGFDIISKKNPPEDTTYTSPKPYQLTERQQISDQLPGAIIKTKIDTTHPLAYGLGSTYFTLKTSAAAYQINHKLQNAIWIGDALESYGFIGSRVKKQIKNSPVVAAQPIGNGSVVYLVDHPIFRSFWQAGKIIVANALLY